MSYLNKAFNYFNKVLYQKFGISKRYLRSLIVATLTLIVLLIRIFSLNRNKLTYYGAMFLFMVLFYSLNSSEEHPLLNPYSLIAATLLFLIPFVGELALAILMITGVEGRAPHITMLIRGIRVSTKLKACGFPVFLGKGVCMYQPNKVTLGDHVSIYDNVVIFPATGEVVIGDKTHIDCNSVIRGDGGVFIGNHCAISSGVKIYSVSNQAKSSELKIVDQPLIKAPIIIEDDVWIGANVVVLPGVRIKRGAVVGAGAVVPMNKILEEYTVYVGVPVKALKKRGE